MTTPINHPRPDLSQTLLAAGIGRSGTTWLGDLLNVDGARRVLFEPLHPDKGLPLAQSLPNNRYVPPDADDLTLRDAIADILSGGQHNAWTDQYEDRPADQDPRPPLVKAIRLNLLLPWLHRQFPEMPMVYILRHPGAVIGSQMRMNWGDGSVLQARLLSQAPLAEGTLKPVLPLVRHADDEFARRLAIWCAVQFVLRHELPDSVPVVRYEDLVLQPGQTLPPLYERLSLPYDEAAVMQAVGTPSATTWSGATPPEAAIRRLDKWREGFSAQQLDAMDRTLACFGLDGLYHSQQTAPRRAWAGYQPQPDPDAIAKLNRRTRRIRWTLRRALRRFRARLRLRRMRQHLA